MSTHIGEFTNNYLLIVYHLSKKMGATIKTTRWGGKSGSKPGIGLNRHKRPDPGLAPGAPRRETGPAEDRRSAICLTTQPLAFFSIGRGATLINEMV